MAHRSRRHRSTPEHLPATRNKRSRELGQNFLIHPGAIRAVLNTAAPSPTGLVLEPGAGTGALTAGLAPRCGRLIAYELDPRLAARLRRRLAGTPGLTVRNRDFLQARPPGEPFAVVGNIPYAATAPIVEWCLRAPALTSATLVVQLEYARKRTGGYGRWSRLTAATWPLFEWRMAGRIDRDRFRPVPRVDSAVLRLHRRPRPLLPGAALPAYRELVHLGFTGTGGTLEATLRRVYPRPLLGRALRAAGVPRGTVVAFVTPEQWIALFRALHG